MQWEVVGGAEGGGWRYIARWCRGRWLEVHSAVVQREVVGGAAALGRTCDMDGCRPIYFTCLYDVRELTPREARRLNLSRLNSLT